MLGVCGASGAAEGPRLPLRIHVDDMNTNKHKHRSDQKKLQVQTCCSLYKRVIIPQESSLGRLDAVPAANAAALVHLWLLSAATQNANKA